MFNIGGGEVLVIALIALIVVGPEQLPGVLRKAGRYANQFRSTTTSLRQEFMSGIDELDPTKWDQERGSGSADSPIVPRGFSGEKADKTPGAPIKPVSAPMGGVDPEPGAGAEPGAGSGVAATAAVDKAADKAVESKNSIANANSSAGLAASRAAEAEATARREQIAAEVQAEVDALGADASAAGTVNPDGVTDDAGHDPASDQA